MRKFQIKTIYDPKKADIGNMNANILKRKWMVKRRTIQLDVESDSESNRSYKVSESEELDDVDRDKYRS